MCHSLRVSELHAYHDVLKIPLFFFSKLEPFEIQCFVWNRSLRCFFLFDPSRALVYIAFKEKRQSVHSNNKPPQ